MILTRLQLQHYRNYVRLDLELYPGATLFHGINGAGKTNILEAVFTLATTKSFRARQDREVIDRNMQLLETPFYFARLQCDATTQTRSSRVEMLIELKEGETVTDTGSARKRFRLDGVPRRASEVVGHIKAVLFSPSDIDIVTGAPSLRRRYLDVMLCQVDRSYLRLLQSYGRIVQHRNAILGRMTGQRSRQALLDLWDEKLISEGSEIVRRRARAMSIISAFAGEMYEVLSGQAEVLAVGYAANIGPLSSGSETEHLFRETLNRESGGGSDSRVTLVGPHRDDLDLLINNSSLQSFGSRGQQRTAALALRMAEARYIESQTAEQPILLLDEALGELDATRQGHLLTFVAGHSQVLLTGTSVEAYPANFLQGARIMAVKSGQVFRESIERSTH